MHGILPMEVQLIMMNGSLFIGTTARLMEGFDNGS